MSIDVNVQNDLVIVTESSEDITVNVSNAPGPAGVGVPSGGSTGQVLKKLSGTNYDTYWAADGQGVPYIGATGDVNLGEFELKAGQLTLDTSPTGTAAVGTTRWNDAIGSSETTLKGGSVILKNGVDLVARVVNKVTPNATLTKAAYQAVRVSGAQGQRLAVAYAQANNDANSADTIGLVTETIPTNQEGFIITVGQLEGINTTGSLQGETWVDGDVLYLSPTTPGAITKVKPTGNGHIVVIGYVEYAHANNGKIYVKVMNGWELDELHDVAIVSPANNEALIYESSTQLWKNKTIASALGYTPISGTGATGQVAYWNGTNSQTGSATLTYSPTSALLVNNSVTAASAIARGTNLTPTLVAAANNDVLVGLDINPTFTIGAFTGTTRYSARISNTNALLIAADGGRIDFVNNGGNGRLESSGGTFSMTVGSGSDGSFPLQIGHTNPSGTKGMSLAANIIRFQTGGFGSTVGQIFSTTGNWVLQNGGTFTDAGFRLDVNGTARVSGDATFSANVGIGGTAVPYSGGAKCLNLFSNTTIGEVRITNSTTGNAAAAGLVLTEIGVNGFIVNANNGFLAFATNNTTRATLDASGNLGLGVTPSAWSGLSGKVFEFGTASGDKGSIFQNDVDDLNLMSNVFFNGSFRYVRTGTATIFRSFNGSYRWSTAPSGTAGNAITFTQAMTLTSGGNLLVGTATDNGSRLQVNGQVDSTNATAARFKTISGTKTITIESFGSDWNYIRTTGQNLIFGTQDANTLYVRTNDVDRLTIASTGAATFSSSVTATNLNLNNGDTFINVSTTLRGLQFGFAGPSHGSYRAAVMGGAENYGSSDSGMLTFHTQNGYVVSAIPPERMRITSGGNLLVGTTVDNGSRLQVSGTSYFSGNVAIGVATTTRNLEVSASSALLAVIGTSGSVPQLQLISGGVVNWSLRTNQGSASDFTIYQDSTERIRIASGGNFGIGVTPTAALDISASTTARATMRIRSGVAPTTPNNGDIWFDGTDLKMRIGGVTKTFTLV